MLPHETLMLIFNLNLNLNLGLEVTAMRTDTFKIKNVDATNPFGGRITPRLGYFRADKPDEFHIGPDFTREVSNGIRFLKRVDKRWYDHIALDALNLDNAHSCVLGQTAVDVFQVSAEGKGNYWDVTRHAASFGISSTDTSWTNSCGFNISISDWEEQVETFIALPDRTAVEADDFLPGMFNQPHPYGDTFYLRAQSIDLNEQFMWARLGDEWKRRIHILRDKDKAPAAVFV